MQIYKHEINDNMREVMEASTSIALTCDIITDEPDAVKPPSKCPSCNSTIVCEADSKECSVTTPETTEATEAAEKDKQPDLYYLKSVLVSAGWNKNDDVFSTRALWAARNTPKEKPFNFMHDDTDIIGHMTDAKIMTQDGKILSDDTPEDDLPEKFDIVTSSVIYKTWSEIGMRMRIADLIEEIDNGEWSVSMECVFTDFDYALVDPKGQDKILARTEESSFLTKHLRAYGGTGEYEGYKLGRLLKGFFFSGKGLVEKPANPRSIIFSKDVDPFNANGTVNFTNFLTLRESNMTKALKEIDQIEASAKAEVDEMAQSETVADEAEVQTEEQVEASPEEAQAAPELEAKVAELEEAMKKMAEENEAMKKFMAMKEEEGEKPDAEMEEEAEEVEAEKPEAEKEEEEEEAEEEDKDHDKEVEMIIKKKDAEIEAMKAQLAELEASVASMSRKASLAEAGIDSETAEKLITKFAGASDEMFATVIELAKSQAEPITEEFFDGEQENEVSASDLEEAEDVLEPSLAEAGEGETQEVAMSTASEWLRNSVLKLTKNLK
jgi:hypothetical protein